MLSSIIPILYALSMDAHVNSGALNSNTALSALCLYYSQEVSKVRKFKVLVVLQRAFTECFSLKNTSTVFRLLFHTPPNAVHMHAAHPRLRSPRFAFSLLGPTREKDAFTSMCVENVVPQFTSLSP